MSEQEDRDETLKAALGQANRRVRELESARDDLEAECESLRKSEAFLKAQYQGLPIPTYTWQKSGDDMVLVDHNLAAAAFTGGNVARFVGSTAAEMYGTHAPDIVADLHRCVAEQRRLRREVKYRFLSSSEEKHLKATYVPVSPDLVMVHTEDITERDRMEAELVRLERLRALEEMGSGVAHNFNNLLVGVLGYAQLIQMRSEDDEVKGYLENIVESALRGKALVERLNGALQTDRRERVQRVSIEEVAHGVVDTYRPLWKDEAEARGVEIQMFVDVSSAPPVAGNVEGLRDILTNLVLNAVDALPEGGTIQVKATETAGMVRLTVSDDGVGMDEETRKRVFDPFFTSKADIGTGLGLSVAHTTAVRWGGRASVVSRPGEGTTFTFVLPVWRGQAHEEGAEETEVEEPKHGLRLMVVDDDDTVRNFLKDALADTFEISIFENGRSALGAAQPGRFDVALIDLGMPGIPGDQVAAKIRETDPTVACVLITGWALSTDDPRLKVFDFQMTKPFTDLKQSMGLIRKAGAVHRARAEKQRNATD